MDKLPLNSGEQLVLRGRNDPWKEEKEPKPKPEPEPEPVEEEWRMEKVEFSERERESINKYRDWEKRQNAHEIDG